MSKATITCRECKIVKPVSAFPEGHLLTTKNFMVCSDCSVIKKDSPKTEEQMRRAKSRYEQMMKRRAKNGNQKIQDELWNKLSCGVDVDADAESFTESEELDGMMHRYEEALMLYISGLEDMPEWMDPEENV